MKVLNSGSGTASSIYLVLVDHRPLFKTHSGKLATEIQNVPFEGVQFGRVRQVQKISQLLRSCVPKENTSMHRHSVRKRVREDKKRTQNRERVREEEEEKEEEEKEEEEEEEGRREGETD